MSDDLVRSIQARLQIIDGILDALLTAWTKINHVIRGSLNRMEARDVLLAEPFCYSEMVADRILDLTVGRQTVTGIEELRRERKQAADRLAELE
jgi:DNA gyrase/topoisomerase IV subunit A